MAFLQSSLLPCTCSPLSTLKPCGFHHVNFKSSCSKNRATSFAVNSAPKQKNPEAKNSPVAAQKTRYNPRTETSLAETSSAETNSAETNSAETNYEIGRVFSLLKNDITGDFRQLHGVAVKSNAFAVDCFIGNKLVTLYSKNSDLLDNVRKMFDEIPKRIRLGYAALINAYCRSERWEDMFLVLALMVDEGVLVDKYVLPTVLKACSALKLLRNGKMIHGHALRNDLVSDVFVGNALINFYANCGELISSRSVFDSMMEKDVVSWTSLVSAYMNAGFLDEAINVFHSMHVNGLKPDLISWNALVSGFARNGEIDLALRSLEEMQEKEVKPKVSSWNGIISGCVQNKYFEDGLDVFYRMLQFPEYPNFISIASILPACAGLGDLNLGRSFHGFSLRHQLYRNVHVQGSLIDMYAKCGRSDYGKKIFDKAENKNTALWNEMIAVFVNDGEVVKASELLRSMQNDGLKPDVISFNTVCAGYARNGQKDKAYELFSEMTQMNIKPNIVSFNVLISGFQQSGLTYEALKLFQAMLCPSCCAVAVAAQPNSITIASTLAACAQLNLKRKGKEIHGYSLKNAFERNAYVSSALVHMYSKCHDTTSASKVFRRIVDKNTICWNALIAGHVNNAQPRFALELFREMLTEGVEPSSITIMVLLLACGDMAGLRSGREIHGYVLKRHFDKCNGNLDNALIGMYAKCGSIDDAKSVFYLEVKDVALWNSTISACSVYGISNTAITLFEQLELAGILPHDGY